ncbi:MAG: alpha-ketoglutarate-dependent dioxygenase AlkB [Verrucomicrobiales bacterium]|nr:alpha-ketoglutarate-dependent dioxygenase AlkB [Verrucomicrobiales bacterium]
MTESQFDEVWQLHPKEHAEIRMLGRAVKIPRWQQAYGVDYHFSGAVNRALPVPVSIAPLLTWSRGAIDERLNGLLLNWYDGNLGHYIGRHRDSITNLVTGAPIVTISFGEGRIFRLRRWRAKSKESPIDFPVTNWSVLVMPFETNRAFTHEVPASKKWSRRRVSVTLRAFVEEASVAQRHQV